MTSSTGYVEMAQLLWGIQAVLTLSLAVVMGGVAWRLGHPLIRVIAAFWIARTVMAVEVLVFFTLNDPARPAFIVAAAVYGGVSLAIIPLGHQLSRTALAPTFHVSGLKVVPWLVGGAVAGALLHLGNVAAGYSEARGAIWTRVFVYVPLILMCGWMWRAWLQAPERRPVTGPLALGSSVLLVMLASDAVMRYLSFMHIPTRRDALITVTVSLAGNLLLGVLSLIAALEAEREVTIAHAQRLQEASDHAAEAQRLQNLGALASGVAHDFNNILGVILSGTELAESILDKDPDAAQVDLMEVRKAAQRGTNLTQRLLKFSRRQPPTISRFDPGEAVEELVPMLQRLLGPQIQLAVARTPGLTVHMDWTQFEQVLMNLVLNARDAVGAAGRILVTVAVQSVETGRAAMVGELTPGRWITVAVDDTGHGIPDGVLQRLFDPFFTTKGDKGTGIGLATVASAVRDAKGAVDVTTRAGHGTRFEVWLPG